MSSFPRLVSCSLLGSLAFSLTAAQAAPVNTGQNATPSVSMKPAPILDHVPGEFVVKFRDAASSRAGRSVVLQTLQKRLGRASVDELHPFVTDPSLALIRMKNDSLARSAMKVLEGEPSVVLTEPNYIYHALNVRDGAQGVPNDPDFSKQWGMSNLGQADSEGQIGSIGSDIGIASLWEKGITGNKKTVVAIIDTGIQWDHPDLAANLYTNPGEIAGNNSDDDKNGFVDDIHGWNFAAVTPPTPGSSRDGNGQVNSKGTNNSSDDNGHGTHCAGVIGAAGNNGVGVAGVNWNVSLMPVKFLDANGGGTLEAATNAINYARMMKVKVMSNSWGGGGFSDVMYQAIQQAQAQDILFVAAAGNDGTSNDGENPTYPSSYNLPNVVSVAAIDNRDGLATFSNYGSKHVHVAAPGVNVYSTYMGSTYKSLSGTSMATPHVAGIAALLASEHSDWTFDSIKDRLIKTSVPVKALGRKVMSKGRVSAYNALYGIVPPSIDPPESLWKSQDQVIESDHPYADGTDKTWTVHVPGAKYIRVHFEKIDVESHYDAVSIETPSGQVVDQISGGEADYVSEYAPGDTLIIRLKSDTSISKWGFKMDKVQFIVETPNSR